jgi:geranylgeranyl transferase type-2 subunit beta
MISSPYLDALDDLLRPGMAGLSARFADAQVRFVADRQQPDGGFAGRRGRSDPYYTDFALRTLACLSPDHGGFRRAIGYVSRLPGPPRDAVEFFNVLNARRLGERCPVAVGGGADPPAWATDPPPPAQGLRGCLLPQGGFARSADDPRVSAYHTFLGALCFQMLGVDLPAVGGAIHGVAALRRPDGGYAELAGGTASQTNATAAAVALLTMHDALSPDDAADAAHFLSAMQSADGGLKAHAAAPGGDLLSTFTGLVTLCGLGGLERIDAAAAARFLRSAAARDGGFLASAGDDSPDVEYTYYGLGALAVLRLLTPAIV